MPTLTAVERRLVLLVSAVVFVDTVFYAVIAPLLPSLAHELHLSKLSAGVMTASYPVGTLVARYRAASWPPAPARSGPSRPGSFCWPSRRWRLPSCTMPPRSTAPRFVEGVGVRARGRWSGLDRRRDRPRRRGALIGRALGAAIGGSLFGPVIGTVANAIGRPAAFSGVVVVVLLLLAAIRRLPSGHVRSVQGLGHLRPAFRAGACAVGDVAGGAAGAGLWASTCSARYGCTGSAPARPRSAPPSCSPRPRIRDHAGDREPV